MAFRATPWVRPAAPSHGERGAAAVVRFAVRIPGLRRALLWPVITRPGYWFATACAWTWGRILLGRWHSAEIAGVRVRWFDRLPGWAFGRGGTAIGAIYLTRDSDSPEVLEHERVHMSQWRRYGLAFILLYVAAGALATTNRFEVEAGLELGGYVS